MAGPFPASNGMTRNYIIGIIILAVMIIVGWLVSALGSEKYIITNMATTTVSGLNDLGTTTKNINGSLKMATTTIIN